VENIYNALWQIYPGQKV